MMNTDEVKRNLVASIILIIIIYILGAFFYHNVEGWSFLDSVFFVTTTITTVGYGDLVPVTGLGKAFTIFLIWTGISIAGFLVYSIAAYREKTFDKHVMKRLTVFGSLASKRGGGPKGKRNGKSALGNFFPLGPKK